MHLFYLLLFSILSLSATGQPTTLYEGEDVFTVKSQNNTNSMTPAGSGCKVTYYSLSNSYTVTWRRKDKTEQKIKFKPVGRLEDLQLFQDEKGKQYAIDTSNLTTEGVLFVLLVDLKTKTVSNEGLLFTKLKRR